MMNVASTILNAFDYVGGLDPIGALELASKVTKTETESAAARGEERDPLRALLNIALDMELIGVFRTSLSNLGFELSERPLRHPFDTDGSKTRIVAKVLRPPVEFYLIHVPSWLLEKPLDAHVAAFGLLRHIFPSNSIIYIISRDLPQRDLEFKLETNRWCKEKGIQADFILWMDVAKLKKTKNVDSQKIILRTIFKIDDLEKRTEELEKRTEDLRSATPTELSIGERGEVIRILSSRATSPYAEPNAYFNNFVDRAGFGELERFRWEGNPERDAQNLVKWAAVTLKVYPRGSERAGQSTLGWLIMTLAKEILTPADEQTLVKIILEHKLISDPESIKTLLRLKQNSPIEALVQ